MFRRAELELSMSEGFHPKPRMNFPAPLAVGLAGTDEVMEIELAQELEPAEILSRLQPLAPPGLELTAAELLPLAKSKANVESFLFEINLPNDFSQEQLEELAQRSNVLMEQTEIVVERLEKGAKGKGKSHSAVKTTNIRSSLKEISLEGNSLKFRVSITAGSPARPREVLDALGLADLETSGAVLHRSQVQISPQQESVMAASAATADSAGNLTNE